MTLGKPKQSAVEHWADTAIRELIDSHGFVGMECSAQAFVHAIRNMVQAMIEESISKGKDDAGGK